MMIFTELKKLLLGIVRWIIALLVIASFFFVFGATTIHIWGREVIVPWFTDKTFAVTFFDRMRRDLIPPQVQVIVTNPFDAFIIEIKIALFLTFIIATPIILVALLKYLSPALKPKEKNAIYKVVFPSTILFVAGCVFAYRYVIPATIKILYSYTPDIKAVPFFNISDFISLAFSLMAMTGLMFLLPVFMVLASYFGIIKYAFWKKYWRHVIFGFVVFTAVITPDGTGITMLMLAVPLCFLYLSGMIISRRYG